MYWCETVDGNWGNCRDDCPLHYDVPGTYQALKLLKKLVLWRKIILMQDLIDSERAHFEPNFEESLFFIEITQGAR